MGQPQSTDNYTAADFRQEIIDAVPALEGAILRAVHAMLMKYKHDSEAEKKDTTPVQQEALSAIIAYEIDGTPIKEAGFFEAMDKDVLAVKNGAGRAAEEILKEKQAWLDGLK